MRFRDVTADRGRMFDATGVAGSAERDRLVGFIDSSFTGIHQRDGKRSTTNNLSYYDLIISPKDARGLDLKKLTRATMAQLGRDAGTGGLPPWIAAEHRNTRHPHVHVLIAGIRQTPSGPYRTLQITPNRLQSMKTAMNHDIDRQRDARAQTRAHFVRTLGAPGMGSPVVRNGAREAVAVTRPALAVAHAPATLRTRRTSRRGRVVAPRTVSRLAGLAGRLANHYRVEMERAIRERKWSSERDSREMEASF